jgi:hypothetical protein
MKQNNWKLRPYASGDESGIYDLAKRVFTEQPPNRFSKKYWEWEFAKNPDGPANIWVADDHNEVVGHYAVIPRLWKVEGIIRKGSIVVDVMTDDRYRFQGMFAALGKTSLNDSGSKGILFSYGFPIRKDVMPGHLKVGWKHIFDLPIMVYPKNLSPIFQFYLKNKIVSNVLGFAANSIWNGFTFVKKGCNSIFHQQKEKYSIRSVTEFTSDFDQLWDRSSTEFQLIASRSKEYLKWRYLDHPYHQYQIFASYHNDKLAGYVVLCEQEILGFECGVIVDLVGDPANSDALDSLIDYAINHFKGQRNISLIATMITKSNRYFEKLKEHNFVVSPKCFWFITHINSESLFELNFEQLYAQKSWFITWGDTDTI